MRRKRSLLWWLTVLAVLAGLPFAVASLKRGLRPAPATRVRGDLLTTCTRVVDGDTIVIEGGGVARGATAGQPQGGERVRYIGIDTPETKHPRKPVEHLGREASEFNRQLVEGKRIRIEFDVVQRDRYKRLLGYVYVQPNVEEEAQPAAATTTGESRMVAQAPPPVPDSEVPTGEARMVARAPSPVPNSEVSTGEARMVARAASPVPDSEVPTGEGACRTANGELFVNAELVRQGYAKVYTVPPNVKYAKEFLELQREARENERGLWGTAGVGRPITDVRQPTSDKRRPTSDVRHPKPD